MTESKEEKPLSGEEKGEMPGEAYSFIREIRKKKPEDKILRLKKISAAAGLAVFAGLLAALVFALSAPVFQKLLGGPEKIEMVSVASSSAEEAEAEQETDEGEPEEASREEKKEAEPTPEEKQEEAIRQYNTVYRGMAEVAETAKSSMVEVIGITSSLDYFNRDYENRQSLSGIIVAESQSSLYCLAESRNLKHAEKIQVVFSSGDRVNAEFKAADRATDLAILSINRADIEDAVWNSISVAQFGSYSTLQQGTPVIALGSIFGLGDGLEYGFITSKNNTVSLWDANYSILTTDMIGNSSGSGCLLNLKGEVVGLIDQSIETEDHNLITAIPAKQLNTLIEDLINGTDRVSVGIKGQTVTSDISESSGIPRGVLITAVEQESPAMYAGMKELDVITAVEGEKIEDFEDYRQILSGISKEGEITVDAMRMGKETYEEISFRLKVGTK